MSLRDCCERVRGPAVALAVFLFLLGWTTRSPGQSERLQLVPNGVEFQVNTYTLGSQYLPRVVADSEGRFLAVWESDGQDGSGSGVFAQRFDSAGARLGSEFQVGTYTVGDQSSPALAVVGEDDVVVVWQDSQRSAIRGRLLDSASVPVGDEFQVNSSPSIQPGAMPSLTALPDGGFIVVWEGYNPSSAPAVLARRFLASAEPVGTELQVNPLDQTDPSAPDVGAGPESIVVTWQAPLAGSARTAVFARRYDSEANPLGNAFQVRASTKEPPLDQFNPAVAVDSADDFVVVWSHPYRDGQDAGVFALRYEDGEPSGTEFQVNSYTRGAQTYPVIASDVEDGFIITWTSSPPFEPLGQDGSGRGVFGQQYDSTGETLGSEFQVNAYTLSSQQAPAIATSPNGELLVVWQSSDQDGDGEGIFAQRFGQPSPTPTPTVTPTVTPTATVTPTPTVTPTGTPGPPCPGDCNLDRVVTVDELVTGVQIALGRARFSVCRAVDPNRDFQVTIAELTTAVGNSINGCSEMTP